MVYISLIQPTVNTQNCCFLLKTLKKNLFFTMFMFQDDVI